MKYATSLANSSESLPGGFKIFALISEKRMRLSWGNDGMSSPPRYWMCCLNVMSNDSLERNNRVVSSVVT
jgi:hypothetical protein